MLKKINLFVAAASLAYMTSILYSQPPDTSWIRWYNGPANSSDYGQACAISGSNFLYVVGQSVNNTSNWDYLTVKYNAINGDTIWTRRYKYPGGSNNYAYDCAVDCDGYLYVTGTSINGTNNNNVTIKYNPITGDTVWTRKYSPLNEYNYARACAVDSSGNLYVVGYSTDNISRYDYVIVKYNSITGDTIWSNRYDGPAHGYDAAYGCATDSIGNIYVTGLSYNGANNDYLTIKCNAVTGDTIWTRRYNGSADGNDWAFECVIDRYENLYVTGRSFNGTRDACLTIKYNAVTGDTIWVRQYSGPSNCDIRAMGCAVDNNGNLYITGYLYDGVIEDYYTIKYNANTGDTIWSCQYNSPANSDDAAYDCVVDNNSNLYVCGTSFNGTSDDYLTIKYNAETGVAGKPDDSRQPCAYKLLQNWPNPFKQSTTISYQLIKSGKVSLAVYNIAGQKIKTLVKDVKNVGMHTSKWNGKDENGVYASPGIYFCRLQNGLNIDVRKMIVVR